ncbi:MAG TPA: hypothetical protein VMB84_04255 [Stellaceae bacterium]|nr:hypothetical protein [Stellaceae bacterium]
MELGAKSGLRRGLDELATIGKVLSGGAAVALVVMLLCWESAHPFAIAEYDDIFDHLKLYQAIADWPSYWAYLWTPHNEHHILTTRMIATLDLFFDRDREYWQPVAANLCMVAAALLACRAYAAGTGRTDAALVDRFWVFAAITLFFINPNFLSTLLYPFQVQWAIAGLLCVAAAFVVARVPPGGPARPAACIGLVVSLLAIATLASLTLANAPVILIGAAAAALVLRWRWPLVALLAVLAVLHTVVMLRWNVPVGSLSTDPLGIAKFALVFLGSPFLRLPEYGSGFTYPMPQATWWGSFHLALYSGIAIVAVALAGAVLALRRPGWGGRTMAFGLTLLAIVGATALASGPSRLQFGLMEAATRKYASFAALAWVGALMVAAGAVRQKWGPRHALNALPVAAVLLVVLPLSLIGYRRETLIWRYAADRSWEDAVAAFVHVDDKQFLAGIFSPPPALREYIDDLERHGNGVFSLYRFRWGDDVAPLLRGRIMVPCLGVAETPVLLQPADRDGMFDDPGARFRISGWSWFDGAGPAATLVAVDRHDRIVGLARTTRSSTAAATALGQDFDRDVGWFGFARLDTPDVLRFVALSPDRRRYCLLGGEIAVGRDSADASAAGARPGAEP